HAPATTESSPLSLHDALPISGPEFRGMVQQLRLGTSFEEVMQQLRERFVSKELNIFVSTVVIQHRVGGNLAEVLSIMADTLEERSEEHTSELQSRENLVCRLL